MQKLELLEKSILEVLEECSEEDWDAYGAYPVSRKSIDHVRRFVNLLDDKLRPTDYAAEPSGDFCCIWFKKNDYHIALGISDDSVVAYGAIVNGKSCGGTFNFVNDIDQSFLDFIECVREV